jgi:nicotinamide-nucleotide amidase
VSVADELLSALAQRGWTVGAAESLTGGLVVSALVAVPGASASVRGGIIAYATDLKGSVLGVDEELLARAGAVDASVAGQMAAGARRVLGADVGIATTGVAGPDAADGHPVGTVFVAVVTPAGESVAALHLKGSRHDIRSQTVRAALDAALSEVRASAG